MALNGLLSADVPLRTYTLTHSFTVIQIHTKVHQFLMSSFSVIGQTYKHMHKDKHTDRCQLK